MRDLRKLEIVLDDLGQVRAGLDTAHQHGEIDNVEYWLYLQKISKVETMLTVRDEINVAAQQLHLTSTHYLEAKCLSES